MTLYWVWAMVAVLALWNWLNRDNDANEDTHESPLPEEDDYCDNHLFRKHYLYEDTSLLSDAFTGVDPIDKFGIRGSDD